MSALFVKQRNHSSPLLHVADPVAGAPPPSLVAVGVGTAGGRRALAFLQRMSELSGIQRMQSAVFYDCNETTVGYIDKFLRKFLGRSRQETGIQVIFPGYIPVPDGFMRDPRRFEEYIGPMERDLDNIVAQIKAQSERCGRAPETIIEFMGFDGHAILGARLHEKLQNEFPATVFLPVLMLPRDHVSRSWTRRYIWEQYESLLDGARCIVTSQSESYTGEDDARLATGLACFEVTEYDDESTPDGATSQLSATYHRLVPSSAGWLGMATVKRKMPLVRKVNWMSLPPRRREYAAFGSGEDMANSLDSAIWSAMEPGAQMVEGVSVHSAAPQEMVVSLPVHPDALEPVARETAETLERSSLFSYFPNMDIAFNAARLTEGLTKEPYMHITRIYPIQGELATVMNILHPGLPADEWPPSATGETGFGSYYHYRAGQRAMSAAASPAPLYGAPPSADDPDWRRQVRYI